MEDNTYNGYTNYETWAAALWIDNDQGTQEYWAEQAQACWDDAHDTIYQPRSNNAIMALAAQLKAEHEDAMPEVDGLFSDLLTAALGSVDWYDIAENMLEEVDKSEEDDEEDTDDEEDDEAD